MEKIEKKSRQKKDKTLKINQEFTIKGRRGSWVRVKIIQKSQRSREVGIEIGLEKKRERERKKERCVDSERDEVRIGVDDNNYK